MVDVQAVGNDQIVSEVMIDASPEIVFAALTDPAKLKIWWGDDENYHSDHWTIDLRVGGQWRSEGIGGNKKPYLVYGEFVEIDPPRVLAYTWNPSWVEAPGTVVRYELTPKGNGTHLRVTHSGFAGNEKAREQHSGWPRVLNWLKSYVER